MVIWFPPGRLSTARSDVLARRRPCEHPRYQFLGERLDNVSRRPDRVRDHIDRVALRGEHHVGTAGLGPDRRTRRTAHSWKHEVEQDDIRPRLPERGTAAARRRLQGSKAGNFATQKDAEHLGKARGHRRPQDAGSHAVQYSILVRGRGGAVWHTFDQTVVAFDTNLGLPTSPVPALGKTVTRASRRNISHPRHGGQADLDRDGGPRLRRCGVSRSRPPGCAGRATNTPAAAWITRAPDQTHRTRRSRHPSLYEQTHREGPAAAMRYRCSGERGQGDRAAWVTGRAMRSGRGSAETRYGRSTAGRSRPACRRAVPGQAQV